MPSFARNQFVDMDDLLCKQLLGLDLGVLSKASASTVGFKNKGKSCTLSSAPEVKPETSHWIQPKESHWSKTGFWSDRSISMVEGDVGGLGWASDNLASLSAAAVLASSASSLSSGATSSRYKTELCRTFTERGMCKYGSKCQFAHGPDELRDISRHPKYKTEPCRTFHSIGFCPYGIRCHFVHNNDEDDDDFPRRPQRPSFSTSVKRPPLLKQSFSFAGFPSSGQLLDAPVSHASFPPRFSTSPSRETISDLLTMAFPDLSPSPALEPMCDSFQPFLPSPDSGYSQFDSTPSETAPGTNGQSLGNGTRSPSLTSLSDHDGCCTSSSSSLSGSDVSSASDAAAKRLPIFSQLSVPDDGFCSEGSASFFL